MKVLLARHGNTFAPGDEPVWVGKNEDLPLVEAGEEQARKLALWLEKEKLQPGIIYTGPLKRTCRFAEIIAEHFSLGAPIIEDRLTEIDYGSWGGKSNPEIAEAFGKDVLDAWSERGEWPKENFGESENEVAKRALDFAESLRAGYDPDALPLVVSSNGILRYFLRLFPGEFEERRSDGSFKMKTGAVSLIHLERGVELWDFRP